MEPLRQGDSNFLAATALVGAQGNWFWSPDASPSVLLPSSQRQQGLAWARTGGLSAQRAGSRTTQEENWKLRVRLHLLLWGCDRVVQGELQTGVGAGIPAKAIL